MKGQFSVWLLLLVLGTACSQKSDPALVEQSDIRFSTQVQSRGASTTTASIREFVCFGYLQGTKLWESVKTTATSDLMWNNEYTGNGNNWVGETATSWPDMDMTESYAFFAYAPAATNDNNIELLTNSSTLGYQKLKYQTLPEVEKQIDLVVASRPNQHRANQVSLAFAHALTRVGFAAFTNIAGTKISSISINGVTYKGDLPIYRDAVWENISGDKTTFRMEMVPELAVSLDETTPTDLSLNASYCFNLLPQDLSSNTDEATCITVGYNQGGVAYTKSYTLKENLGKGLFTVYKVNLSGDPNTDLIVSKVTITDWVFDSSADLNTNDGAQEYELFTASYNANGGTGVPATEQVAANKKLTIGVAPTSTPSVDHLFLGYNTKADGSGATYSPGTKIALTENITLYAIWDTNFEIIDNLKWAKGNLVGTGANGCKIGSPEDGGLYFQFGSLIGWKGGATGNGIGRSALANAVYYSGGATFNATDEVSVYPSIFPIANIATTWPVQTTNTYYFGDQTVLSSNYDLKEFTGYIDGNLAAAGVGDPCRHYVGNSWRQPTTQEIQGLYNTANTINHTGGWWISSTNSYVQFSYADGAKLKLPIVGCREADGRLSNNGLNGYYSSSSVYDKASRYYLFVDETAAEPQGEYYRHTAMPVRCVKDL